MASQFVFRACWVHSWSTKPPPRRARWVFSISVQTLTVVGFLLENEGGLLPLFGWGLLGCSSCWLGSLFEVSHHFSYRDRLSVRLPGWSCSVWLVPVFCTDLLSFSVFEFTSYGGLTEANYFRKPSTWASHNCSQLTPFALDSHSTFPCSFTRSWTLRSVLASLQSRCSPTSRCIVG